MVAGVVGLASLVILHGQGYLSLHKYGLYSLPIVFLVPIGVALALGGYLSGGLVTNWSNPPSSLTALAC